MQERAEVAVHLTEVTLDFCQPPDRAFDRVVNRGWREELRVGAELAYELNLGRTRRGVCHTQVNISEGDGGTSSPVSRRTSRVVSMITA